jgi:hypothetical protein
VVDTLPAVGRSRAAYPPFASGPSTGSHCGSAWPGPVPGLHCTSGSGLPSESTGGRAVVVVVSGGVATGGVRSGAVLVTGSAFVGGVSVGAGAGGGAGAGVVVVIDGVTAGVVVAGAAGAVVGAADAGVRSGSAARSPSAEPPQPVAAAASAPVVKRIVSVRVMRRIRAAG